MHEWEEFFQPHQRQPAIFALRHESRGKSHNLRDPDLLAQEIVEALEVALEQFRGIATNFGERVESLRKAS
jgi:type I restriction enzyme M protein